MSIEYGQHVIHGLDRNALKAFQDARADLVDIQMSTVLERVQYGDARPGDAKSAFAQAVGGRHASSQPAFLELFQKGEPNLMAGPWREDAQSRQVRLAEASLLRNRTRAPVR